MKNKQLSMTDICGLPCSFDAPDALSLMPQITPILVGFSGGPDSRALLDLLCRYSKKSGCEIFAAHINHSIRGEEADRDEQFCIEVAKDYGIRIFVHKADVPWLAKESGKSIELCARDVRYEFFSKVMRENSIPLLATAHNANDNLETVLFNLSRGSGIAGLSGIPPKRECEGGLLIRPILRMSREEIIAYCEKNKLDYVIDSTNVDTDYTRNKIRAEAIPVMKEINQAAEKKAAEASFLLRRDDELLCSLADTFIKRHILADGSIPLSALNGEHPSISSRALMMLYGKKADISLEQVHVEDILKLALRAVPHSRIDLPKGICAKIEDGRLYFVTAAEMAQTSAASAPEFFEVAKEGNNPISPINAEIIIGKTQTEINIYKNSIQFALDSAKINGTLIIRSKKAGDRILMGGMHKSVKKLMCDKKIPIEQRNRLPVLADDEGIVAIPYLGVCDRVRPKKSESSEQRSLTQIQFYLY